MTPSGFLILALGVASLIITAHASAQPVGVAVCGRCHPAEIKAWRRGPHAQAYRSLAPHQRRDPHCRACHDDAGVSEQLRRTFLFKRVKTRIARGVDCESCHGLGGDLLDKSGSHVRHPKQAHMESASAASAASALSSDAQVSRMCSRCHALDPITTPLDELYPMLKRHGLSRFTHGLSRDVNTRPRESDPSAHALQPTTPSTLAPR